MELNTKSRNRLTKRRKAIQWERIVFFSTNSAGTRYPRAKIMNLDSDLTSDLGAVHHDKVGGG